MLKRPSSAGSIESGDVLVNIEPSDKLNIKINSGVYKQFGKQILKVVEDTLKEENITCANVILEDKGALDCVIKSRLKTAIYRALEKDYEWERDYE